MRILTSEIDSSVNFVWDLSPGEALEARYVRRENDYFACYLSSQTACAKACRMCHLTQTGQNRPRDATDQEIIYQAKKVFKHYLTQPTADVVHYNFMARGEPMASEPILQRNCSLFGKLNKLAMQNNVKPRILISTIMPKELDRSLTDIFPVYHPDIYYSLYSMDKGFRRKWLPQAMPPERALELLAEWQVHTKKIPRLHWALIKGENDHSGHSYEIANACEKVGLRADITLVWYNPYNERLGEASWNYGQIAEWWRKRWPHARVKQINRVGADVAASCGMFTDGYGVTGA